MQIEIRNYTPPDIHQIRALLLSNGFSHLTDDSIYRWQFEGYGEPIIKVAVNDSTGRIVGHYGLMPCPFLFDGQEYPGGKIEGSVVHKDYRSNSLDRNHPGLKDIRIFPLLIAEMEKEIRDRGLDFVFGFPNDRASRSQLRVFRDFSFEAWNLIRVFDWERFLSARLRIGNRTLLRAMKTILGPVFYHKAISSHQDADIREGMPEGIEEFCRALFRKTGLISLSRDKRFMQWKYMDSPVRDYSFVSSYSRGKLDGTLVYSLSSVNGTTMGEISDLICDPGDDDVILRLVAGGIEALREKNAAAVSFFLNKGHMQVNITRALKRLGFIRIRRRQNAFLYVSDRLRPRSDMICDTGNWYITPVFRQY